MRKHTIKLLVITMTAVSLTRCGEPTPEPAPFILLIKFKQAHYKEHIMVMSPRLFPNNPQETLRMRPLNYANTLKPPHFYPYLELGDGYLLFDWKWESFYYVDNEAIIRQQWAELTSFDQEWPISDLFVDGPVMEKAYISEQDFLRYQQEIMQKDNTCPIFNSRPYPPDTNSTRTDSLQQENAIILRHMIKGGYLHSYSTQYRKSK